MLTKTLKRTRSLFLTFLLLVASTALMAQKTINGKVSDANGQPLAGASIQVKGTNTQTLTDAEGRFSLNTSEDAVLQISNVGFGSMEVKASEAANIRLQTDTRDLGEVVVTALGIRKEKKKLGYAIQEVKGEDLTVARRCRRGCPLP